MDTGTEARRGIGLKTAIEVRSDEKDTRRDSRKMRSRAMHLPVVLSRVDRWSARDDLLEQQCGATTAAAEAQGVQAGVL